MNVAHRCFLTILLLFSGTCSLYGMVADSRYFPWLPRLYNASDNTKRFVHADMSFLTASSAMLISPGVRKEEQTSGYPGFYGVRRTQGERGYINMANVGKAFEAVGLNNPMPVDWRFLEKFYVKPESLLQAQTVTARGYVPLTSHIGFGASGGVMRVCGQANFVLTDDIKSTILYDSPGNKFRFSNMMKQFEDLAQTQSGYWKSSGLLDTEVYMKWYDVSDYTLACKKIDKSVSFGLIFPTGNVASNNNIASVPFAGNGFWGWYISPHVEFELKDDLKVGLMARIQKRFAKTIERRIPVKQESSIFAPIIGDVQVNPGANYTISPYGVIENLQSGVGLLLKYTLTWHDNDEFKDMRSNPTVPANFHYLRQNETWAQEYLTVRLFYDFVADKNKSYQPVFSFEWDIPTSWFIARGVSNTHRVSLGMTVNF